jgi:glucose-1-phosphate cytidylyltransferase
MKAVILAGGLGTRLSEETESKPKPMIEIGGKPILWHIMKIYSHYGVNEFVVCLGYKGYVIKEYFNNYFLHQSDVTFDIAYNSMTVHKERAEPWKVTLVDTGDMTMTGGRLRRVKDFIKDEKAFCFTYGDGVANIDIRALIDFHMSHNAKATLTGAFPPGRFGALGIDGCRVTSFQEKPKGDGTLINAGFFVLSPKVIDYIETAETVWEQEPLMNLAKDGELRVYRHTDFWQPMDTLRDKNNLNKLWDEGRAPWKIW